jgi:hypothetical protein
MFWSWGATAGIVLLAALVIMLTLGHQETPSAPDPVRGAVPEQVTIPLVCVTREIVCDAPSLPTGYPCTCIHPLRGRITGTVFAESNLDRLLDQAPFERPSLLDGDN